MVPHHAMAVEMAEVVLERGKRSELWELANLRPVQRATRLARQRDGHPSACPTSTERAEREPPLAGARPAHDEHGIAGAGTEYATRGGSRRSARASGWVSQDQGDAP